MIDINENDFRRLDLNLLLVFSALLRERSVTKAAQRLFIGQPALSAALGRLREFSGDELFVRTARGMEPTPHALAWSEALKPLLEGLGHALFEAPKFDPATSERTFTLGMSDILELVLAPGLLATLAREAPGLRLSFRPADPFDAGTRLDDGSIDLALATVQTDVARHRLQPVYQEQFVCLYDPKRVHSSYPLTLDEFLAVPHLMTSFRGGFSGFVDEALAAKGLSRQVIVITSRFATLPPMLVEVSAIATLPATVAYMLAPQFGLAVCPVPVVLPKVSISMLWHARSQDDPGHAWLRERVVSVLTEAVARVPATVARCQPAPKVAKGQALASASDSQAASGLPVAQATMGRPRLKSARGRPARKAGAR